MSFGIISITALAFTIMKFNFNELAIVVALQNQSLAEINFARSNMRTHSTKLPLLQVFYPRSVTFVTILFLEAVELQKMVVGYRHFFPSYINIGFLAIGGEGASD